MCAAWCTADAVRRLNSITNRHGKTRRKRLCCCSCINTAEAAMGLGLVSLCVRPAHRSHQALGIPWLLSQYRSLHGASSSTYPGLGHTTPSDGTPARPAHDPRCIAHAGAQRWSTPASVLQSPALFTRHLSSSSSARAADQAASADSASAAQREQLKYDVCIVGAGPAGLAAAIRIKKVLTIMTLTQSTRACLPVWALGLATVLCCGAGVRAGCR